MEYISTHINQCINGLSESKIRFLRQDFGSRLIWMKNKNVVRT